MALSSIPGYVPGQPIYVALHADVVLPTGETDSAWAEGTGFPGANWSSYKDVALLPTVLTFDETTLADGAEQPIAAGYGGLTWDQVGIYNPNGMWGYAVKSESNLAFIAEASTFEVEGYPSPAGSPALIEGDMAFVGAWFSAAQQDRPGHHGQRLRRRGARRNEQVTSVNKNGPTWIGFDDPNDGQRFESIDRLEMNANDGDPATMDYFGLDDMTFFPVWADRARAHQPDPSTQPAASRRRLSRVQAREETSVLRGGHTTAGRTGRRPRRP